MHRDKKQNVIAIFYLKVKNNSEYVFFSTNEVFTSIYQLSYRYEFF